VSARLVELTKTYRAGRSRRAEPITALRGIDLDAAQGELLVIVGPSGSGKSTLLRCVAGLERPDSGRVFVSERDVTKRPAGDRDVAMVFQDLALYPHVSARDNITFGLRARGVDTKETAARVEQVSSLLAIEDLLDRRPSQLSGGEQQRVALARAIARRPALYLMDEPLSDLDAELRVRARSEIRALQRRLDTTCLYVTHDQIEAMTMGDRVAVLREGKLEQIGPPVELYDHPETAFVARFLGSPPMNLFPADLLPEAARGPVLGLRPEHLRLSRAASRLSATVVTVEVMGDVAIVHADAGGHRLLAKVLRTSLPEPGETIHMDFDLADLHAFDGVDGRAV
jgi:ABC-type sugar transport system ATPase subunit